MAVVDCRSGSCHLLGRPSDFGPRSGSAGSTPAAAGSCPNLGNTAAGLYNSDNLS